VPEASDSTAAARAFWSGTITFGLVSIPVNLLPAVRSGGVSLRMVSEEGAPLSRRYFATADDRMLEWDEIVRGYEIENDRFVVVTDDELERIAPERTRDIDLRVFVEADSIDPIHFERAYYLTPAGGSTKAYRLLARVMEETGRAGIATFVMRAKEYLVAILAENGILRAETLRFADEIRSPEAIGLPEPIEPKAADVKAIEREIASRTKKALALGELGDTSGERLTKLAMKKARAGRDVVAAPPEEEDEGESRDIIDLMEMLQRSLKGEGRTTPAKGAGRATPTKGEELEGWSKADLYDRAQELDIPGRSGMTKQELIRAIRRSA
jgi:DNA end-binding protein Ku